jgi:diguanylate cyclase (GGDEF)-like protein/PAS domain S-box-containing protein
VVAQAGSPILLIDSEAHIRLANAAACQWLGYTCDELQSLSVPDIDTDWPAHRWKNDWPRLCVPQPQTFRSRLITKDRTVIPVEVITNHVTQDGGEFLLVFFHDPRQRQLGEQQVNDPHHRDALTQMPNREVLQDRLSQAIRARHDEDLPPFALLFCDMDRFKVINDSLGHLSGDELLVRFSTRVARCVDEFRTEHDAKLCRDTICRMGGDEFVILLDPVMNAEAAAQLAEQLLRTTSIPYRISGHDVLATNSMGIVLHDKRYKTADQVLRDADNAMYRAKDRGGNCYVVFDKAMHDEAMARLVLEYDLARAVESDQFTVHYQPIVSLADGSLRAVEALIRWQHPAKGLVSPAQFIPIAEETGLIVPIGRWVLETACRQMADWQHRLGDRAPRVLSVNLSRRQLIDKSLLEDVRIAIGQAGLDPGCIELEVTESVVMDNLDRVLPVMERLRSLEVALALDDFGTGHSSLSCLHEFPIDTLKIDRAFIANMGRQVKFTALTQAIISLAHDLGIGVVAEGIETLEQLTQLQALECNNAQGYYFAKPLPADELEQWIVAAEPLVTLAV